MEASDIEKSLSTNISWSSPISSINFDLFTLTITSTNTQQRDFQLQETYYYVFNRFENAPACEVYNFSVTAIYVGATYTGAGCSEPSPVISRMLPSLPVIQGEQSFVNLTVEKSSGELTVSMNFKVKGHLPCASYLRFGPSRNSGIVVGYQW